MDANCAFLGRMRDPIASVSRFADSSIPNAFFSSVQGHPFWLTYLEQIKDTWLLDAVKEDGTPIRERPETLTGPEVLKQALVRYNAAQEIGTPGVIVLPPESIYPFGLVSDLE